MSNLETALAILQNEVDGDISSALQKLSEDYSMTWMYQGKEELFPSSSPNFSAEMGSIYAVKGRKYEIKNSAENGDTVFIELIESYPDPETGRLHQTPLVLVLEFQEGKIRSGRHYCDPKLSHLELLNEAMHKAYRNTVTKQVIE